MDRTCQECGATFTREKSRAIYCSRKCANRAAGKAARARRWEAQGIRPDAWKQAQEDRRARIEAALDQHPGASNRQIGRMLGVSHHTVGRVRAQPADARCRASGMQLPDLLP